MYLWKYFAVSKPHTLTHTSLTHCSFHLFIFSTSSKHIPTHFPFPNNSVDIHSRTLGASISQLATSAVNGDQNLQMETNVAEVFSSQIELIIMRGLTRVNSIPNQKQYHSNNRILLTFEHIFQSTMPFALFLYLPKSRALSLPVDFVNQHSSLFISLQSFHTSSKLQMLIFPFFHFSFLIFFLLKMNWNRVKEEKSETEFSEFSIMIPGSLLSDFSTAFSCHYR